MEERKLEWESEDAKKQRAVRDANREMDARAGSFTRNWEDDPSVHHAGQAGAQPAPQPELPAQQEFPEIPRYAGDPSLRERRAERHRAQELRRRQRPRRRKSRNLRQQIGTMRRIRVYLFIAVLLFIIAGVIAALMMQQDSSAPAQMSAGLFFRNHISSTLQS
ncbi:MAG: hypothetical protein IKQ39_03440 [Oscillospiraceae bacterium]|nr:hypothetical protein [Oscillospiraceae bacterium]